MISQASEKTVDESLFGLLSVYKFNITYIRVLESEKFDCISVQMTDNPRKWSNLKNEKYKNFRVLRRLEIGTPKLSIKFLNPTQILMVKGPLLGIRIPVKNSMVFERTDSGDIHIMETTLDYRDRVLRGVRNLLNMTPQKKLELIEKCIDLCVQDEEAS